MADELDDEERALIEKHRASKSRDNFSVRIRKGDDEAELPYHKAKSWLQNAFGIDLDDEEPQDEDDEPAPKSKSNVKRFQAGRRVS